MRNEWQEIDQAPNWLPVVAIIIIAVFNDWHQKQCIKLQVENQKARLEALEKQVEALRKQIESKIIESKIWIAVKPVFVSKLWACKIDIAVKPVFQIESWSQVDASEALVKSGAHKVIASFK